MSRGSSGCVLRKINQLFTCEKRCDSVEARNALLKDFTSKVYSTEVVYVGSDGNFSSEEQYYIVFILSGKQKEPNLNIIHGNALVQKDEDTPKNLVWTGKYLAKKGGYKIRVSGDNIEKDFYVYCDGNDKINFLFKKTVPEDLTVRNMNSKSGVGTMQTPSRTSLENQLTILNKKLATLKEERNKAIAENNEVLANTYDDAIDNTEINILIVNYDLYKTIPNDLEDSSVLKNCIFYCDKYNFCQDSNLQQIPAIKECNSK